MARKAEREPVPTQVRLYSPAEREERTAAHYAAVAQVRSARMRREPVAEELALAAAFGPGTPQTRPARLARVKAFLASGKVPAAWGKPTPAYEGRAPMSEAEARRVVLPNFPKAGLKLLPGDLGVERAVSRYLALVGEREVEAGVGRVAGHQRAGGGWVNGTEATPGVWSCGCKVWSDTMNVYSRPSKAYEAQWEGYQPARVDPCGKHLAALKGEGE